MGKYCRSIGQLAVTVNLGEREGKSENKRRENKEKEWRKKWWRIVNVSFFLFYFVGVLSLSLSLSGVSNRNSKSTMLPAYNQNAFSGLSILEFSTGVAGEEAQGRSAGIIKTFLNKCRFESRWLILEHFVQRGTFRSELTFQESFPRISLGQGLFRPCP